MALLINRRIALALAGAAIPATGFRMTAAAAPVGGALIEHPPSFSAVLPRTRYFEIDSVRAGARYAVWVTPPATYDRNPGRRYPVIYQPDGNGAVLLNRSPAYDPINPIQPFVGVSVGYTGEDASRSLAVRARDLLPPHETLPDMDEAQMRKVIVQAGLLDDAGIDLYIRYLRNPAADRFLDFLTEELHPLVAQQFRVETDTAGLWGYSFGGLFTTYASLRRSPLFHKIGAGSPGIAAGKSKVFSLYEEELKSGADYSGRLLHMTVNEREITVPGEYQKNVGQGAAEFMTMAGQTPLKGLSFSSRIVEFESHASGSDPAWYSFLRTAYPVRS